MRPMIVAPLVRCDDMGDGHFGAPRGDREHRGVDYLCRPGDSVFTPCTGVITKLGFPYDDVSEWRYVEVTDSDHRRHRLFYVSPTLSTGTYVWSGTEIGKAQDISLRYGPRMKPHIHYEIIDRDGVYQDAEAL